MIKFILNHSEVVADVKAGVTLLDFIRYNQHLTGTKIGCREGDCGACTVLVGELLNGELYYRSVTSCLMPVGNANGKHIVTIEGVNMDGLNPIQQAMSDEGATQCGFCTPGFVMSLAGYCLSNKEASEKNAVACIDGNICRCTGYKSIERAAMRVNESLSNKPHNDSIGYVTKNKILPDYFSEIKNRLLKLNVTDQVSKPINQLTSQPITLIGGGTDLYVQKHDSMHHVDVELMFDKPVLNGITQIGNTCFMGAAVTVTDMRNSAIFQEHFPHFERHSKLVSSTPIRNMATLAGNFVNASPIGDFTVFFLALNAQLHLSDGNSMRTVALRNFYKGYKVLDKKPEEYIEKISFELPDDNRLFNFEKVCKRTHLDIASVNTAVCLQVEDDVIISASLSAGGVGPVPMYLTKASDYLPEKKISEAVIQEAINIAQTEISPISDARGTDAYKRLLLTQLLKAHFVELFPLLKTDKLFIA